MNNIYVPRTKQFHEELIYCTISHRYFDDDVAAAAAAAAADDDDDDDISTCITSTFVVKLKASQRDWER